jgi:hypothetical protein
MPAETTILDASTIAEEAFVLAYPLVLMDRTMAQATAVIATDPETMRAPVNALVHGRDTPDTLRTSGWLDLAAEPIVLSVADTSGRFYALWLRDAWNTVFASVGPRTTGTAARAFAVLGPGRERVPPAPGLTPIEAPTRMVRVAGCIEAVGESDDEARRRVHDGFELMPLSRWQRDDEPVIPSSVTAVDPVTPVEQLEHLDSRAFFEEVSRLVDDNPPGPAQRAALGRLREIGAWEAPGPELRASLERGVQRGRAAIRAQAERPPGVAFGSWSACSEFGRDAAGHLRRAGDARSGLRADPAEDRLCALLDSGADGRPFTGRSNYLLRFAPAAPPPVEGFWSLETCDATRISTDSIGDLRGLALDRDGSLPIHIRHEPPASRHRSNWLPAPPDGFSVALNLYWPREEALQRRWSPPPIMRLG